MFRLHERTRRRICRAGFLALCAAPTIAAALWCVGRHLPGRAAAEAERLRGVLGLEVSLDAVEHTRPGEILYTGFYAADPETGRPVLACGTLRAGRRRVTHPDGTRADALVLVASEAEIVAGGAEPLVELLGRLLRRQLVPGDREVQVVARQLTVQAGDRPLTFPELRGCVVQGSEQSEARFDLVQEKGDRHHLCEAGHTPEAGRGPFRQMVPVPFFLPEAGDQQPVRVRVVRYRQTDPPTSGLELDTGGAATPIEVLALFAPTLDSLGPECRFRGRVLASRTLGRGDCPDFRGARRENGTVPFRPEPGDWDVYVVGELLDLDVGRVVRERSPHQLTGTGRLTIRSARFREGRLAQASVSLSAGPGIVGRSLVAEAAERLALVSQVPPDDPDAAIPYEEMRLSCSLDDAGVRLEGLCSAGSGVVLSGGGAPLLREPSPPVGEPAEAAPSQARLAREPQRAPAADGDAAGTSVR